jgi:putative redox protein
MTSSVIYEGGLRTTCKHLQSGSFFETDAPTDNQGKGERFSPTDLVASALASCMLTTMAIKAKDIEAVLHQIRVDVEKIMSWNPRRISGINLTFHFPEGFVLSPERQQELEQIAWTCPVKESIHPGIELNIAFNWPGSKR